MRKYYASEKPLPADQKAVQRLVGARTKEEREAVTTVLEEFFSLQDDGWHNTRCDEEIVRCQDKQAKAKRSAKARWSKPKTHSGGNANASPDAMRTHSGGNAHQTPDTSHQSPDMCVSNDTHKSAPPSIAGAVCLALKNAGIPNVNQSHPDLLDLLAAGAGVADFERAAHDARTRDPPPHNPFSFVLGTVKGRMNDAKNQKKSKGKHDAHSVEEPA